MGTPLLYTEGGQIKSRIGGNVQIFINGVRADDNDLKTFWPMNAIRVEYIQNPDDPRFEGASNVVNFIMKEYTYGGLTSVDAFQAFPNSGQYSLASKFVYKKMTYSASAEGRYSRDHISGEYEQEDFRDVWYQGKHYDQIERRTTFNNNADRNDRINASFVARYNNQGRFIASHSGVFSWNRNPGSFRNGSTDYTPMLFNGTSIHSYSENRNPSAGVTGRYNYIINSKFSIAGW